jgi:hypothetical protein
MWTLGGHLSDWNGDNDKTNRNDQLMQTVKIYGTKRKLFKRKRPN